MSFHLIPATELNQTNAKQNEKKRSKGSNFNCGSCSIFQFLFLYCMDSSVECGCSVRQTVCLHWERSLMRTRSEHRK